MYYMLGLIKAYIFLWVHNSKKIFWLYNFGWNKVAILFFNIYYYKVIKNKGFKTILKYTGYFYLGFSLVYIVSNGYDFFYKSFPVLNVIGALIIFICTMLYFIELLQSQKFLLFIKYLSFYISVVVFIWWLIVTPISFYDVFYSSVDLTKPFRHPIFFGDINYITLRKQIYLFSNIFMYLTYTLIWCKPEND